MRNLTRPVKKVWSNGMERRNGLSRAVAKTPGFFIKKGNFGIEFRTSFDVPFTRNTSKNTRPVYCISYKNYYFVHHNTNTF